MRYGLLIIVLIFSISGCASTHEAWHLDQEFGQASRETWAKQIAYPERINPGPPQGINGITAEEIMSTYNKTFAEKPQEINVISFGSLNEE